jgi:hypothetical protein
MQGTVFGHETQISTPARTSEVRGNMEILGVSRPCINLLAGIQGHKGLVLETPRFKEYV